MNYETVMEMQRICAGEKCELTRGQIAEETIDIKKETKNLPIDKAQACEAFYEKMRSDASKKSYDIDSLMAEKKRSSRNSMHSAEKVSEMTVSTLCMMLSVNFL